MDSDQLTKDVWHLGPHDDCQLQHAHAHPRPRPAEAPNASRRFELHRDLDVSGVSGTGVVAEGVAFTDGTAVVHWIAGEHHSTVVWPDVAGVEAIHGHGGATRLVWLDR